MTFVSRMITCLALWVPFLAAEIDRARPDLPTQLRERFFQAEATETIRNPSSEPFRRATFFFHRIAQNIAYLFFHAAAVFLRALLQTRFHILFEVAHDELGGLRLCHDIMISYRRWGLKPRSLRP